MKSTVTKDEAVSLLNEMLQIDYEGTVNFIGARVQVNDILANHPTIQCGIHDGVVKMGPLGFLNGLFKVVDMGSNPIIAVFDDKTRELQGFKIFEEDPHGK